MYVPVSINYRFQTVSPFLNVFVDEVYLKHYEMKSYYFLGADGQQYGPVEDSTLKNYGVTGETPCR